MKQIFINISILLSFVIYSSLHSQTAPKLEVTINDTNVVKKLTCTDTLNNCWGYELGEEYFYIQHFGYGNKYDTVIVYYDETKKDTMMFQAYHGYKKHSAKQWNKKGKLIKIHDTKLEVNKAWYSNGQLRWDKVVTGNYNSSLDYDERNRIWYSNGNIMYEYEHIGNDTIVELYHYRDGGVKSKNTYLLSEDKGNGYQYPEKYLHVSPYIEENYCKNGQLLSKYTFGYTEKDKKSYFCNGNTKGYIEKYYKQMRLVGKYLYYYETGQLRIKGQYKEYDNGPQNVSVAIGEWNYYNIDGTIERKEFYDDNGKLLPLKE